VGLCEVDGEQPWDLLLPLLVPRRALLEASPMMAAAVCASMRPPDAQHGTGEHSSGHTTCVTWRRTQGCGSSSEASAASAGVAAAAGFGQHGDATPGGTTLKYKLAE
jgi:hypothetical protein